MKVSVLVPLKAPGSRKSRLRGCLSDEERHNLSLWMLDRVLGAVAQAGVTHQRFVVGEGGDAGDMLAKWAFASLPELGSGLNDTLEKAVSLRLAAGDGGCLIIPADLPFISPRDVSGLVRHALSHRCAVIVPNRKFSGTNGLFIPAWGRFPLAFGPDSYRNHRRAAAERGVPLCTYDAPGMTLDVDDEADLAAVSAASWGWRKG